MAQHPPAWERMLIGLPYPGHLVRFAIVDIRPLKVYPSLGKTLSCKVKGLG
jgi:hypothetical protein